MVYGYSYFYVYSFRNLAEIKLLTASVGRKMAYEVEKMKLLVFSFFPRGLVFSPHL